MLDDSDEKDKYEGTDDSEYHFSDEEVNYEVEPEPEAETETPAPKAKPPSGGGSKEKIIEKLIQQKRLIISVVVFLGLIFVVYKMVSPTSTVPSTDITPAPIARAPTMPPPTTAVPTPQQPVIAVTT